MEQWQLLFLQQQQQLQTQFALQQLQLLQQRPTLFTENLAIINQLLTTKAEFSTAVTPTTTSAEKTCDVTSSILGQKSGSCFSLVERRESLPSPVTSVSKPQTLFFQDRSIPDTPTVIKEPTALQRILAPSPANSRERHSNSPATSSSSTNQGKEDELDEVEAEDDDVYVDVEEMERPEGRDRRKRHVEFYRKLKNLRKSAEDRLECAQCRHVVEKNDSAIMSHLGEHTEANFFRCRKCGHGACDLKQIYTHMTTNHPNKVSILFLKLTLTQLKDKDTIQKIQYDDRRDWSRLCEALSSCFPRQKNCVKKTATFNKQIDVLIKSFEQEDKKELVCSQCNTSVPIVEKCIIKHIQSHPTYRCKTCRLVTLSLNQQIEHQKKEHNTDNGVYNVCLAQEVLQQVMTSCFGASQRNSQS